MSTKAFDREKRRAAALRQNIKRRKAANSKHAAGETALVLPSERQTTRPRPNKVQKTD